MKRNVRCVLCVWPRRAFVHYPVSKTRPLYFVSFFSLSLTLIVAVVVDVVYTITMMMMMIAFSRSRGPVCLCERSVDVFSGPSLATSAGKTSVVH